MTTTNNTASATAVILLDDGCVHSGAILDFVPRRDMRSLQQIIKEGFPHYFDADGVIRARVRLWTVPGDSNKSDRVCLQ